ncbi:S8 family serine peptidase [Thalassotalea fonticola]|uniref:S8 family serine peptidase n=1 Tax=Thalassotalea fonticola TaxID=3065649 RepID=A0ABZ0GPM5_9GAMM|nr:S8 family serine peptidase [Colwelliaceae bacterium S1-1]
MNFKLNKLALALPMSLVTLGAVAAISADDIPRVEVNKAQKNAMLKASKKTFDNHYFVLLEDEPVALYQGGIKGFKATNVAASNGVNANQKGKLNLKSSASVVYGDYLAIKQNEAFSKIKTVLKRDVVLQDRFKVALNGLVMQLQPNEALALRKIPGVLAVEKEEAHQLLTDVGPQHVGAPSIWENPDVEGSKGEGLIIGVMDTGISSYTSKGWSAADFDNKEFHPSFADVGVDGYDHTNPNGEGVYFGDCVDSPHWCNDKVIGVISYDGMKTSALWDLRSETGQDDHGHGTHVASTIAGNRVDNVNYPTVYPDMESQWDHKYYTSETAVSISGVAPHANIISYKTCSVEGCAPSAAVASIEHAIANGVDVLNYSVGGGASSPWFTSDALAFLSAREAGIHTAVAAGNSGQEGEKTVGSPGNSPWVTTVAALSHSRDFTEEKTASFAGGVAALENLVGKGGTSGITTLTDIVYAGDIEDPMEAELAGGVGYCGEYSLPDYWDMESIEGKVVICRRGGVDADGQPQTRLAKGGSAKNAKAAGMIFINSDEDLDNVENDLHVLPTVHLNKADGEKLLAWLAEGEGHQVSFSDSELVLNNDKADITADFTSRGPDYFTGDYLIPDVGAPGVDILAGGLGDGMQSNDSKVWEKVNGEFRFMSGTSMATPHIAGMYLLMKAAQPNWTPAEAQSALMMTAFTDVKEDDDLDGIANRADMHRTGSGSARVNLAVNAGLVMNETRAGYEAANPSAEKLGISDSIAGWHGQPHQMNMPSLSKGECLLDCSWTRTFKATKAATWTVTFEYYNEGFSLTSDTTQFTVTAGEEVEVNFSAKALQGLDGEWANARVVLTPDDVSIPVQTLPVTVNFIAGMAPDEVDVTANRNNDSVGVDGIVTIGSDDLQMSKSGIAKADIYEFELMRDATNQTIYHWDDADSQTIHAIPLNIQADSKRLVVEVLNTSSPDLDIYVGIDSDLDGEPSVVEMGLMPWMSATETSYELIDEISPRPDTYWVLVHNWAEGPAPLADNEMVCAEGQQADEGMVCAEAPIMDNVKLSITNVKYDEDNMSVDIPVAVEPRAQVSTRLGWDQVMTEGDIYHGVFWLGTSAELDKNIGAVRVNMTRGEDDIKVSEPVINDDKLTFSVRVAANNSVEDVDYDFNMTLADNVTVDLMLKDDVVAGVAMKLNTDELAYKTSANELSWSHTQAAGSNALAFNIVLDTSNVEGIIDTTPVIESSKSSSEITEIKSTEPVFVSGRPIVTANSSAETVASGEMVSITAITVDAVIESPEMSYKWHQTLGPVASLSSESNVVSFIAPEVINSEVVKFELIAFNGHKYSLPTEVVMTVEPKVEEEPIIKDDVLGCTYAEAKNFNPDATQDNGSCEYPVTPTPTPDVIEPDEKSSGGSTSLGFLMLSAFGLMLGRRK